MINRIFFLFIIMMIFLWLNMWLVIKCVCVFVISGIVIVDFGVIFIGVRVVIEVNVLGYVGLDIFRCIG